MIVLGCLVRSAEAGVFPWVKGEFLTYQSPYKQDIYP
jgi:hypothetical protein